MNRLASEAWRTLIEAEPERRTRYFIIADLAIVAIGVTALVAVGTTTSPIALRVLPFPLISAALLVGALIAARTSRGLLFAVMLIMVANAVGTIGSTAFYPGLVGLTALAVLLPAVVFFDYAPRRTVKVVLAVAVANAGAVVAVGDYGSDQSNIPGNPALSVLLSGLFAAAIAGVVAITLTQLHTRLLDQALDLQVSRRRIASASDDTRRLLERNLHDGAQQRLVALMVNMGVAKRAVLADPTRTEPAFEGLRADLQSAIDELRTLVSGIYPPLLAERGLEGALRAVARRSVTPCEARFVGVGRYPSDVEAAVYFCCLEALQNVDKHAAATVVDLVVDGTADVSFTVSDDGRGFDATKESDSLGLHSMRDRVGAVGGSLTVSSGLGGTTIRGVFPATQVGDRAPVRLRRYG